MWSIEFMYLIYLAIIDLCILGNKCDMRGVFDALWLCLRFVGEWVLFGNTRTPHDLAVQE
jgi:hypothetical protein